MRNFKNKLSKEIYGMSFDEALSKKICVHCREEALPKCYSEEGREEYYISGLCEKCFDELTKGEKEEKMTIKRED